MRRPRDADRLLTTGAALDGEDLFIVERARGAYVWDAGGRRYLDGLSGLWCAAAGYGSREVAARVSAQLKRLSYAPLDWRAHRPALELADALLARAPRGLERVYFCSGGSEAVETALKAARLRGGPGRSAFLYRKGSYHGAAFGATSVTGFEELRRGVEPLVPDAVEVPPPDCAHCPFGKKAGSCALECAGAVESALDALGPGRAAALIAEPVAAAGRVQVPPPGYWPRVSAALERAGALLILDEVLTGLGRTGPWFAAEHWDLRPDVLLLGKGLAGGYAPLAAALFSRRALEPFRRAPLAHGYTFQGHPAACAAALAVLAALEELIPRAAELGAVLGEGLRRRLGAERVAALGLLASVELALDASGRARMRRRTLEEGLLCGIEADALQLAPPLSSSRAQVEAMAEALARAVLKGFPHAPG